MASSPRRRQATEPRFACLRRQQQQGPVRCADPNVENEGVVMSETPAPKLVSSRLGRRAILGGAAGLAVAPALMGTLGAFPSAAAVVKAAGDTAPLPPSAIGPSIPEKGYLVDEI